jgi:hypothetical protein
MLTLENTVHTLAQREKTWITEEDWTNLFAVKNLLGHRGLYELKTLYADGERLEWNFAILRPTSQPLSGLLGQAVSGGALADLLKRRGSSRSPTSGLLGFRFELSEINEDHEHLQLVFRRIGRTSLVWRSKE